MAANHLKVIDVNTPTDDRQRNLDAALKDIERNFGAGSIMRLGTDRAIEVEAVSTGSVGLDVALGIGGLPRGRVIEIYGPESSGKTTLGAAYGRRSTENRGYLRLCRRGTRAGSHVRAEARSQR